jgi:hypothetical protein
MVNNLVQKVCLGVSGAALLAAAVLQLNVWQGQYQMRPKSRGDSTENSSSKGNSLFSRKVVELENVGFGGYNYDDKPNATLVFYDDRGNRVPMIKRDNDFDHEASYDSRGPRIQGLYNVRGHRNFWGSHATEVETVDRDYTRDTLDRRD